MQKLHPDRHRNKSHQEQDELHNRASSVTHAYRVLNAPHHRAVHLLGLMGKSIDESTSVSVLLYESLFLFLLYIDCAHYS
jgi:DnaJ-domain-containing protein 1